VNKRTIEHEGQRYEAPGPVSDFDIAEGRLFALFVHKMSYDVRDRAPIFILRDGFAFQHFEATRTLPKDPYSESEREARAAQVVEYVRKELAKGVKLTRNTLESHIGAMGLTRVELRIAVDDAIGKGNLAEVDLPKEERKGRKTTYLSPRGAAK
jgi:translation elongation factor EF-1beta